MSTTEHPVSGVEESDPDTLTILFVTVIGTLLVAIVVLVLQGLYEGVQHAEIRKKVVDELPQELQALRVAQFEKLAGGAWTDQSHGVARIPIATAMALIVHDPTIVAVPPLPSRPASADPHTGAVSPPPPARPASASGASARGAASSHAASRGRR